MFEPGKLYWIAFKLVQENKYDDRQTGAGTGDDVVPSGMMEHQTEAPVDAAEVQKNETQWEGRPLVRECFLPTNSLLNKN